MRFAVVSLALLASGCASDGADSFDYQSSLSRNARGLVLHQDGSIGHAGMMGTNCPFETSEGSVTGDYQLPGEGEKVVDSGDLIGENTVLLLLGDDAHLLDKSTGEYTHETLTVAGLEEARLYEGGIVALSREETGACLVSWSDSEESVAAPCGDLDVNPETGLAVIAHERGVSLVSANDVFRVADFGDSGVYDHNAQAIYTSDAQTVRALEEDGTLRWEVELEGRVVDITEAGATGAAAVFVALPDGAGQVVYLDGDTGARQASVRTPGLADELTVSADGSTVAITRAGAAHFYRLSAEWRD
ncbi:MAG: hypothetical protein KC912_00360 [Proteobacteria bacterium]|nr:hypothetical protein [Pseudomonadota bacterium]